MSRFIKILGTGMQKANLLVCAGITLQARTYGRVEHACIGTHT